jgi:hypothetical protein
MAISGLQWENPACLDFEETPVSSNRGHGAELVRVRVFAAGH